MDNGKAYLRKDMNIECSMDVNAATSIPFIQDNLPFRVYYGMSIVFALIYPVGVPALFFFVLYYNKDTLFVSATTSKMYRDGALESEEQ